MSSVNASYTRYYKDLLKILSDGDKIRSYHLYVRDHKWQELVKKDDLRFFKHSSNVVDDLKKQKENGIILKACHWNYADLHNDYMLSKKIKHANFAKYICYFEYEEDIIHCLMNNAIIVLDDIFDENAVVILPHYSSNVKECSLLQTTSDIFKQIILSLYYALYCHHISFTSVSADDIYIDKTHKMTNLKYEFAGFKHKMRTNQVVKLDFFRNAQETSEIKPQHYRQLYNNILQVLKDLNAKDELIEFIQEFVSHPNDDRIVCPLKIIDTIICNVGLYQ